MHKLKGAILVALILLSGMANAQEKNKDVMIKHIFSLLKAGDEEGFVRLFPDAAVTKTFLRSMFEKDTSKEATVEMLNEFLEKLTDEELQKGYREEFQKTILEAANNDIDLAKAIFVSYTADSAIKEDETLKAPMLSGKIYFTSGDTDYFMAYRDIIWFENKGWYGVSINRIDKKSRENEPEPVLIEEVAMDSVKMIEVDTGRVQPPPPPPPKKIKPTAPPAKPVKGKTTTAAGKPDQ